MPRDGVGTVPRFAGVSVAGADGGVQVPRGKSVAGTAPKSPAVGCGGLWLLVVASGCPALATLLYSVWEEIASSRRPLRRARARGTSAQVHTGARSPADHLSSTCHTPLQLLVEEIHSSNQSPRGAEEPRGIHTHPRCCTVSPRPVTREMQYANQ